MTSAYETGTVPPIEMRHRLRIAREFAGLEKAELAERIGISRNTVGNAENGKTRPQRVVVNAWALATGVPVNWLQTGVAPNGPDGDQAAAGGNLRPADYQTVTPLFLVRKTVRPDTIPTAS